jgi:hypothetical protein
VTYKRHINDPAFGVEVTDLFADLMAQTSPPPTG